MRRRAMMIDILPRLPMPPAMSLMRAPVFAATPTLRAYSMLLRFSYSDCPPDFHFHRFHVAADTPLVRRCAPRFTCYTFFCCLPAADTPERLRVIRRFHHVMPRVYAVAAETAARCRIAVA